MLYFRYTARKEKTMTKMDEEEKALRKALKKHGQDNADYIYTSTVTDSEERKILLAKLLSDLVLTRHNNSTKVHTIENRIDGSDFYLGFVSDIHSKLYLLENYLHMLNSIGGKCVVTGDVSNGSNHFKGHDNSLNESFNLDQDILTVADVLKRYPDMFIGYVEGNHDQWISEGTSLFIGKLACKIAGVDNIYAKNIQLITQILKVNGKNIPFNFLIVHGEGMNGNIVNSLKKALSTACSNNVDAMIFGHTHKTGSSSATILKKQPNGSWQERDVMAYNPGSILEQSDYADKAGHPPLTPFEGTVLHCRVIKENGKYKKCIDVKNIMNVTTEKNNKTFDSLQSALNHLENKKFKSKQELQEAYLKLLNQYSPEHVQTEITQKGQYFISISGISDMFSPEVTEDIQKKIRKDLSYIVSVAKDIPNLSIVLNGDLVYDYNKGYIEKKDYCADIMAAMQDLCEILKPVKDKICAINSGQMETSIMKVERDKGNGRLGSGKRKLQELANYASQTLQLDEKLAYKQYDKQDMRRKQLAIQSEAVNAANQKVLDKAFANFKKMIMKNPDLYLSIFKDNAVPNTQAEFDKKVKEYLVEKLRAEHKVLDISDPEDKKIIDRRFPLSEIDLRMPNENLIGNIICKMLNISTKTVKINSVIDSPSTFQVSDSDGNTKTVLCCYSNSLAGFMRDLPAKLNSNGEPPDVVLVNNRVTKSATYFQEFTTPQRISYQDASGKHYVKDVQIINSGSFAYSRYFALGRVPSNMLYRLVDVKPIFSTLQPKASICYPTSQTRPVIEKLNYESIKNQSEHTTTAIRDKIRQSARISLNKFDMQNARKENDDIIKSF